ncbi:MAG: CHASE2 domain-containing protein [Curvibacter sp.]
MSWFSARRAALVSLVRRLGARAYLLFALVFTTLIVTDLGLLNLVAAADTRLFDTMISNRVIVPSPDPDIVILDIDEASLAGMAREHGRWPWPNRVLGEVVRGIEAQQPRAIVFDILFSDADVQRPESDAAFNAEIARSTRTFFPMLRLDPQNDKLSRIPVGALPGARALQAQADAQAPIAIILPRVPAALDNGRLGTHQVTPDKDGIIRRYPAWIEHAGWRIPSLPQRIAEEYGDPGSDQAEVLINWRGKPFTYPYISFVDVYRDLKAEKKERPLDEFKGKIVIIGSTAPSLFDIKGTPMGRIHPGVEILATAIDNFKQGDYLRERPKWVMKLAALLLIWGMAIALYRQTRIRIEMFDMVFGVIQGTLLVLAFAVANLTDWYLDVSAPLSLGLSYFALARVYYGLSRNWLANGLVQGMASLPRGERLLAVMAVRLEGCSDAERRRLKGDLDDLVARSQHHASRIVGLVEDPGFVQRVFSDVMLVYWLLEDVQTPWARDADLIEAGLSARRGAAIAAGRLHFAREHAVIRWEATHGWTAPAFATILSAMSRTLSVQDSTHPAPGIRP